MHPSVPVPHLPALRVPALRLTGRLPVATALLYVLYAAAVAVALTAPGQHALAGCVVLAGLAGRTVLRHHRTATVAPAPVGVLPGELTATAPATAA